VYLSYLSKQEAEIKAGLHPLARPLAHQPKSIKHTWFSLAQNSAQDSFVKNQWETFPLGEASLAHISRDLEQGLGKADKQAIRRENPPRKENTRESNRVPYEQKSTRFCLGCPGFTRSLLGHFFAFGFPPEV